MKTHAVLKGALALILATSLCPASPSAAEAAEDVENTEGGGQPQEQLIEQTPPAPRQWVLEAESEQDKPNVNNDAQFQGADTPANTTSTPGAAPIRPLSEDRVQAPTTATITYLDDKGQSKEAVGATKLVSNTPSIGNDTWYYVDANSTVTTQNLQVTGTAHLILCNGSELQASATGEAAGIQVAEGASLYLYAQTFDENEAGKLVAVGDSYGGDGGAGIGSGRRNPCGTVIINGGTINATSGGSGAGIGGGTSGAGGIVTINGGTVEATSSGGGAGIGGGYSKTGGTITISGGTVEATSDIGAGIGSGFNSQMGDTVVTIEGGTVTATSEHGVGIGDYFGGGSTATIKNGAVLNCNTITTDNSKPTKGLSIGACTIKRGTWTNENKDLTGTYAFLAVIGGTATYTKEDFWQDVVKDGTLVALTADDATQKGLY